MTPAMSTARTARPHSSATSRTTASRVVSPTWTRPPGRLHFPAAGACPRRTSSTRSPSRTTAPTPTRGLSGYSRLTPGGARRGGEPRRGGVLLPDERVHESGLLGAEAVGLEVEPVLGLERPGERGGDVVEGGAPAERRLPRRQRRDRVGRP